MAATSFGAIPTANPRERAHRLLVEAMRPGEQVKLYKDLGELPLAWIHRQAQQVMTPENFRETDTVYGLVLRVNAITSPRFRHRLHVPQTLLDLLEESIEVRSIVGRRYTALLRLRPDPMLEEENRRKKFFRNCLRLCLKKLREY